MRSKPRPRSPSSASILASARSPSFVPLPVKNLIPLSRYGLWDAETTAARSSPSLRTSTAAAGVGRTPPSSASPPASATPAASAASSIGPDSRVSRTISTCGRGASSEAVAARPRASASSAVRNVPASPRTPSVPKSLRSVVTSAPSALAELRALASLLQTGLAPLLGARVAGQEAAPLELAAQLGVDLGQRPGDAVADSAGLAADAAAVDPDPHVDAVLVAGDHEWLDSRRLVQGAGEELLDRATVDDDLATAGKQGHAGDRVLAFAGRQVARVALHLGRCPAGGLLVLGVGGERRFAPRLLLRLGLQAGLLLGAQRPLVLLDRDRLQVGAGNRVLPLLGLRLLGGRLHHLGLLLLLWLLLPRLLLRGLLLVLRSLVVLLRLVGHHLVSIGCGFCATCG